MPYPSNPWAAVPHRIKGQCNSNEIMSNVTILSENIRGVKDFQLDSEGKKLFTWVCNYFVRHYGSQLIGQQKDKFVIEGGIQICI